MSQTPIHPGEILGNELKKIGIAGTELARQLKVPENRITQIVAGKRSITADTALRLGKWFGTTPAFWLNLQNQYDLWKERDNPALASVQVIHNPAA